MSRILQLMPAHAEPQLVLHEPHDPHGDGHVLKLRAQLTASGLAADSRVTISNDDSLASFFERLASGWRGWEGEVVWEALDHQMAIAATHDGVGHVRLRVTLRENYRSDSWSASVTFVIDAGEDLRSLATSVADFLAVGRP
jgi:hypothetical protein